MSGGSMEYVYSRINEAANAVQRELAQAKLRHSNGIYPTETTGYKKHYLKGADGKFIKDAKGKCRFLLVATGHRTSPKLSERTIRHLENALITMRMASIYAERVEWLTSGDDDSQSFCERLEEQLENAKKTGGIE